MSAPGSAKRQLKSCAAGHVEHGKNLCKCQGRLCMRTLTFHTRPSVDNMLYTSYKSAERMFTDNLHLASKSVWSDSTKFSKGSLRLVFPELRIIKWYFIFLNKTFHTSCLPGVSELFPLWSPGWGTVGTQWSLLMKLLIIPQQGPNTGLMSFTLKYLRSAHDVRH